MADSVDTTAQPVTDTTALVDALRASLKDNERLRRAEQKRLDDERDPIAIVGLGCRYPGDADTPERLWEIVRDGRDVTTGFPTDRGWDLEALYDPDPDTTGTTLHPAAGASSRRDPLRPGLLRHLPARGPCDGPAAAPAARGRLGGPRAGRDRTRPAARHRRGRLRGPAWQGYGEGWRDAPDGLQGHLVTGMSTSVISGRIAYTLGLRGRPSPSTPPARRRWSRCTSRPRRCAAVTAPSRSPAGAPRSSPRRSRWSVSPASAASPRTAAAGVRRRRGRDGARRGRRRRGPGAAVRARALGHPCSPCCAAPRSTRTAPPTGLSAPSGAAQQDRVRAALADAGLTPRRRRRGSRRTAPAPPSATRSRRRHCWRSTGAGRTGAPLHLGSVKSNIGHAQAALRGRRPDQDRARAPSTPSCPPPCTPSRSPTSSTGTASRSSPRARPWPRPPGPAAARRRLVLRGVRHERPPGRRAGPGHDDGHDGTARDAVPAEPAGPLAWVLSARDARRPHPHRRRARPGAGRGPDTPATAAAVASGLARHRARLDRGAVVLGEDLAGLRRGLHALATGRGDTRLVTGTAGGSGRPVFVYPGQGAQWAGMARDLYRESPDFAAELDRCAGALAPYLDGTDRDGTDLVATLTGDDDRWLGRVDLVQSGLFAVMVALTALWRRTASSPPPSSATHRARSPPRTSPGRSPSTTPPGSWPCAPARSPGSPEPGRCCRSVWTGRHRERIAGRPGLWLAAENGAQSCVVSGDVAAVTALQAELEADDEVRVRRVPVDYASHSAHVDAVAATVLTDLAPITPTEPRLPLYSTVTGARLDPGVPLDAAYWVRNLRSTVELRAPPTPCSTTGSTPSSRWPRTPCCCPRWPARPRPPGGSC